jgi:hypothetical protein
MSPAAPLPLALPLPLTLSLSLSTAKPVARAAIAAPAAAAAEAALAAPIRPAAAVPEPAGAAAVVALIDREFGNGPGRGHITLSSRQRCPNQRTVPEVEGAFRVDRLFFRSVFGRRVFAGRLDGTGRQRLGRGSRRRGRLGTIGSRVRRVRRQGDRRHELASGIVDRLLCPGWPHAAAGRLATLEDVLGVTRGAPGLSNRILDDGDNGMVGNASFPRTVVVHEVAKTQRALLHSLLQN